MINLKKTLLKTLAFSGYKIEQIEQIIDHKYQYTLDDLDFEFDEAYGYSDIYASIGLKVILEDRCWFAWKISKELPEHGYFDFYRVPKPDFSLRNGRKLDRLLKGEEW